MPIVSGCSHVDNIIYISKYIEMDMNTPIYGAIVDTTNNDVQMLDQIFLWGSIIAGSIVLGTVDSNRQTWHNRSMKISEAQYERIAGYFPVQRGNVKTDDRDFINAIWYIAENGCKWRALPVEFGKWKTIYKKFSRWAKNGVMQRIFATLQAEKIIAIHVEVLALDSTFCKVHPDGHGALKNLESRQSENPKEGGMPSFMWYLQMIRSSLKCTSSAENVTMHLKDASR